MGLRCVNLRPSIQIVRPSQSTQVRTSVDGVPVWEPTVDTSHADCLAKSTQATRLEAYGSSITAGTGASPGRDWPARLSEWMTTSGATVCVVNRAQPGFTLDAKIATFHETLARDRPELVLFEFWANDAHPYYLLGNTAYGIRSMKMDLEGWPLAFPLPTALSRWLFVNSRLYETLSLAFVAEAPDTSDPWRGLAKRFVLEVVAPARAAGSTVVVVTAVPLSSPFSDAPEEFETAMQSLAEQEGLPWVSLRELLADQRPEDVRADACCHFSDSGTELIGKRLAPAIDRLVRDRSLTGNLLRTAGK